MGCSGKQRRVGNWLLIEYDSYHTGREAIASAGSVWLLGSQQIAGGRKDLELEVNKVPRDVYYGLVFSSSFQPIRRSPAATRGRRLFVQLK